MKRKQSQIALQEYQTKTYGERVSMIELSVLAPQVADVAKQAGAYLRKAQKNFDRNAVELKSLNALVSHADRSAEKLIVTKLTQLIPEAGFLTEEGTVHQTHRKNIYGSLILRRDN